MKIYNKIVWDKDGNIIEEDSYEYNGPLTHLGRVRPPPPPPVIPERPPAPPPTIPERPLPIEPEEIPKETPEEKQKEETTQKKRRGGRRGLTTGSPLGYDQPFTGNRRSLL
tara:strand:- start:2179 stop:2511 length:333 start_codon:yes stop_codon:yes gene_type:complete